MGKVETERKRKGGGLIYGTKEGEPCGKVASLAQILWHANLKHWDEAFLLVDKNLIRLKAGIGPVHRDWLRNFRSEVKNQRIQSPKLDYHIIEVLPENDPRNLARRPFVIDALPVFFPNRQTNWAIENLLRGETIKGKSFLDNLTTIGDLVEDLGFLNSYFNLGLELQEIGDGSGEYRLVIPETTKVVENTAIFEVPAVPH